MTRNLHFNSYLEEKDGQLIYDISGDKIVFGLPDWYNDEMKDRLKKMFDTIVVVIRN